MPVSSKSYMFSIFSQVSPDLITHSLTGFSATSRFWRLHVLRNHGAAQTELHGLVFYGVDATLRKWFAENGVTEYYEPFLAAGYNQVWLPQYMMTASKLASSK